MSKFESILSDAEIEKGRKEVFSTENPYCPCGPKTMRKAARWAEQAVLAKLHEQEPVATILVDAVSGINIAYHQFQGLYDGMKLYAHPMPSPSNMNDKIACVSENGKSDRQLARQQPCGCVVCYCENQERCLGCGAKHCGSHNLMEMPNPVYVDHIPDTSKMVKSLRDEFAMAALTGLLSNSGGPIQISSQSGWSLVNCTLDDVPSFAYEMADAMLAAAPKYTGDSNE